ncbi:MULTISPECIES: hypothetical protein [Hafniaceae]|uniref:hypothetical protein n=1 Tax=Hafniaceae TaxID=1903412 RepID=UPI001F1DF491|nr:hypothetical protein [Obesumbacterium proteus]MCE9886212.1 hypothetical protein [Obesumbacterium proteus]MCE9914884.1 hypothetical protein [Obesumbacterium proteus]MCE9931609.1 hypothetical protein [Obesumbacterium proteus]MCG2876066.1 hypothetical protein [Obesumbacterium proteus]
MNASVIIELNKIISGFSEQTSELVLQQAETWEKETKQYHIIKALSHLSGLSHEALELGLEHSDNPENLAKALFDVLHASSQYQTAIELKHMQEAA